MNERNDGVGFEVKVERWLVRKGAVSTNRRERVPGRVAKNGHECDVHAVFTSSVGPAIVGLAIAFVTLFVGVVTEMAVIAAAGGTAFVVLFIATGVLATRRTHIWAECKSGDAPVRRDVVWKLAEQLRDVREHGPAWYPAQAWLVSRNGFDVDAIRFARANGVRLFIELSGDIREVI